ncbi:MAG: MAPEG family protein [Hyphomicrobiaceae bacterium]
MMIPITGFYVGMTIVLAIVLGARVGLMRGTTKIPILHGDNMTLATRIRAHANLTETAALTLLAMAVIEHNGASPALIHGVGIAYIVARVLHPIGLKHDDVTHPLRAIGAGVSTLAMLVAGTTAIWQFISTFAAN